MGFRSPDDDGALSLCIIWTLFLMHELGSSDGDRAGSCVIVCGSVCDSCTLKNGTLYVNGMTGVFTLGVCTGGSVARFRICATCMNILLIFDPNSRVGLVLGFLFFKCSKHIFC